MNIIWFTESLWVSKFKTKEMAHPADIVLALCGDWLIDHFLAANAEENFFNFVQKFLEEQNIRHLKINIDFFND